MVKGRGIRRLKRLLGNGLVTSEEPEHLRNRRMVQPAFHRERIASYGATMIALTQAHCAMWRDGETRDIGRDITALTLDIAAATLFSAKVGERSAIVHEAMKDAMESFPAALSFAGEILDFLPFLPVVRRFNRARAQLDRVLFEIIDARRRDPSPPDDLLQMLLDARDDDGRALDDLQIRDEAMTIFLAGHETTANALTWALYLLARNPHVMQRVQAECSAVLGDRDPQSDDVARLSYTADVVAETLRLYPPAWTLGRIAARDTTLGAWTIPRGSVIIASQLITQRDPQWFPDPLAFRPERRNEEPIAAKFATFPFGGGNRRCIGDTFAIMEAVLVLATLARRFTFEPADASEVEMFPLVTLRPKSAVRLRLSPHAPALADPLQSA
jgi:cytochrome P450